MLRGAKTPGRAKPCRVTIQFATNRQAAQPVRPALDSPICARRPRQTRCRSPLLAPAGQVKHWGGRPLFAPYTILHRRSERFLPGLGWRYIVERGRLHLSPRAARHKIF